METHQCRVCFTTDKLKLLNLFTVKIDDKSLAEMVTFLSGITVSFYVLKFFCLTFQLDYRLQKLTNCQI